VIAISHPLCMRRLTKRGQLLKVCLTRFFERVDCESEQSGQSSRPLDKYNLKVKNNKDRGRNVAPMLKGVNYDRKPLIKLAKSNF